jgi:hypothetical protein
MYGHSPSHQMRRMSPKSSMSGGELEERNSRLAGASAGVHYLVGKPRGYSLTSDKVGKENK